MGVSVGRRRGEGPIAFTYEFLTAKTNRTEGSQANKFFKRKPLFFLSFFALFAVAVTILFLK
jgi:hypothetical protein